MSAFVRFLALCCLTLAAACGKAPPPPQPPEGKGPALWTVARGDMQGWLFGTIHVLPEGVAWQTAAVKEAMGKADRLVLEAADLQDPQKTLRLFETLGRAPGLPPLASRVPADERAALERIAADGGTSAQALSAYKSWAAAMLLSAASQQALHVSQEDGVEPVLIAAFRQAGKPIGGLETVERQFGAFDSLPETAQRRLLVRTVREAKDMKALYDRILAAWIKGDMAAIARMDDTGEPPDPEIEGAIIGGRNRDWVKAVEALKGRPFIAVGAGHLTGEGDLIDLLKAKGFAVERVQ